MNTTALDGTLKDTYSNRLTECVGSLLVEHVRILFREDELKLQSIGHDIDQIQASFRVAESRLRHRAMSRLEKLGACSDRLTADWQNVTAEIQKLEEDRYNVRSLLDSGNSGCWSDLERAEAKSRADTALTDAAQEITTCDEQIETLLNRREQLVQDEHVWVSSKNAGEDLLSSLISGEEPAPYQAALIKDRSSLEAAFQKLSDEAHLELEAKQKAHGSARKKLTRLENELNEARVRASKLESARRNLDRIILLVDPRILIRRRLGLIQRDYEAQYDRVWDSWDSVTNIGAKIDDLGRQHEHSLTILPGEVRQKLIAETRLEVRNASARLAEIARMSEQTSIALEAQKSDLALRKALYAHEHQQHLDAHFADVLGQTESSLEDIGVRIADTIDRQVRNAENRTRLQRIIERRREKLGADLLDLQRRESSQLNPFEHEASRLRLRLRDRMPRAGMVHDQATNAFREKDHLLTIMKQLHRPGK